MAERRRIHEIKCKLLCLSCTAQFVVQHVLELFIDSDDANRTIAEILSYYFGINQLKDMKTLHLPENENKIFTSSSGQKSVKETIEIDDLDISALIDILENIPSFPTCKETYRLDLTCSQCKSTGSNKNVVCCKSCQLCYNCSKLCDNYVIRESINVFRDLRYRAMRITAEECKEIEIGMRSDNAVGFAWIKDIDNYQDAIKNILAILKKQGRITPAVEFDKTLDCDLVKYRTKSIYFSIFAEALEKFIKIPKIFERKIKLVLQSHDRTMLEKISDLDTDISTKVFTTFKQRVINIILQELNVENRSDVFDIFMYGVKHDDINETHNRLTTGMTIHIKPIEVAIPPCLLEIYSHEAYRLRKELINLFSGIISSALMVEVNIVCHRYELKSIHIDLAIHRKDLIKWTTEEVKSIYDIVNDLVDVDDGLFRNLIRDNGLDNYEIYVTFPKPRVISTVTFKMSLDIFGEEVLEQLDAFLPALEESINSKINLDALVAEMEREL